MDIRCPICSEPWDLDTLHDEVTERFDDQARSETPYEDLFGQVRRDFSRQGCEALGSRHAQTTADPIVSEIYALMGDDLDGAASLLEDAEALGLDL